MTIGDGVQKTLKTGNASSQTYFTLPSWLWTSHYWCEFHPVFYHKILKHVKVFFFFSFAQHVKVSTFQNIT